MKQVFAPGCALLIHEPEFADRMLSILRQKYPDLEEHSICCRHDPQLPHGTQVINVCAGCDKRYRELHETTTTISFWEILAQDDNFEFPDYKGKKMSILDACPTRNQDRVHDAIRVLLKRMNIELIEPKRSGRKSTCCGDSFFRAIPVDQVKQKMKERAEEMPEEDVIVYCVSCIKAMHIGGKTPRYLADLLLGEKTRPGNFEPEEWHRELDLFIEQH